MTGTAGNSATTLLIANQTIHIGGEPRWIQTLSIAELHTVRDRLHRAAQHHEYRALMPLILPILLAFLVAAGLTISLSDGSAETRRQAFPMLIFLSALIGFPIWFGFYDVRRRHRRVVQAAECRWAELMVEIAAREDPPPREAPIKRLKRWLHTRHTKADRAADGTEHDENMPARTATIK